VKERLLLSRSVHPQLMLPLPDRTAPMALDELEQRALVLALAELLIDAALRGVTDGQGGGDDTEADR
jgi:hypothetical protein